MQFPSIKKNFFFLFVFLLLKTSSSFAILGFDFSFFNFYKKKNEYVTERCAFDGISGTVPVKINQIIKQLNKLELYQEINNNFRNRLILYGPPGNGKSTFARVIANETHSELLEIHGPSLVELYAGSGPKKINETFELALNQSDEYRKRYIIFIDEIDSIAITSASVESMHQYRVTLQTLWLWLDKIKKLPNIFVVVASNKYKELDATFLSRFGSNVIEIPNPDDKMRREIIEYNLDMINTSFDPDFHLSDKTIEYLVKKTNGFSIRTIEDIITSIQHESEKNIDSIIKIHRGKLSNKLDPEEQTRDNLRWTKFGTIISFAHLLVSLTDLSGRLSQYRTIGTLPFQISNLHK